jgi:trehalose 6-phosphate phosphatase
LATLSLLVGEATGVVLVGTHGAEESGYAVPEALAHQVAELHDSLLALTKQHPGAVVEKKPIGAAFHYRHVSQPAAAAAAAHRLAAEMKARTISGKMVVECVFGDANKGSAIRRFRERYNAAAVMFIGDDTTDEDAFAVLGPGDVGLKVGPGATRAAYRVHDQAEVAGVLGMLGTLRLRLDQT